MYNIQVHVPYEKQQYIKKMNHYITTYPFNFISPSPHPRPQLSHTHAHTNSVVVHHHEPECRLKILFCYLQGLSHILGSHNENVIISAISLEILKHLVICNQNKFDGTSSEDGKYLVKRWYCFHSGYETGCGLGDWTRLLPLLISQARVSTGSNQENMARTLFVMNIYTCLLNLSIV